MFIQDSVSYKGTKNTMNWGLFIHVQKLNFHPAASIKNPNVRPFIHLMTAAVAFWSQPETKDCCVRFVSRY